MKTASGLLSFLLLWGCGGADQSAKTETAAPARQQASAAKAPDENAALNAMARINEAQSVYFKRNRRYALALDELVESRDLKSEPAAAETGYNFRLRPSADAQSYTLLVSPAGAPVTARHFFTDQTGAIRSEQGQEATAQSPPLAQ